ncbi:MAG: SapC family protein [Pseudomonadota bacterium]
MSKLIPLNTETHRDWKVKKDCATRFAAHQHVLNVRAAEVGFAVANMPVFVNRNAASGQYLLSAVTSFEQGNNLYVGDKGWEATWVPTMLQTYPIFLMNAPETEQGYAVGISDSSDDFTTGDEEGEVLFDAEGKNSHFLDRVTSVLRDDIGRDIQTSEFLKKLDALELFKPVDIKVMYADESVQTITGLHTLDEDKMKALSGDELKEMNEKGYLMVAHALLVSLNQLNVLVQRHNLSSGKTLIKQVKLEVAPQRDGVH